MARDGASNQDIATELFVSRKTVEYHLHKVFSKLGISTRQQLEYVLPGPERRLIRVSGAGTGLGPL
jgi:DNA-binding NarL/FixJ family response regulator